MALMLNALAAASVVIFMLVFWRLGVVASARNAVAIMQHAIDTMRNPSIDELTRERAVQSDSLKLLREAVSLLCRSAVALIAAFAPLALADQQGLVPLSDSLQYLARWDVIITLSALALFIWIVASRIWRA